MTFLRTRGKLRSRKGICDRENIHQGGEDAERNKQGGLCVRVTRRTRDGWNIGSGRRR